MTAVLGSTLSNRYRVDARVGSGGMSTVYQAFDVTLERAVAIKLMHREIAGDSDQLERFRREARSVAQLSHPHIVTVIDAGEDEGRPYIVFEFVAGETLKERIRRNGRLSINEAVAYAIEIARALGYAHSRGIVHRDVKPQNILVDEEGTAKITDFGIARSLDQDGLTAEGRVLGTTDYVSPEQALGQVVDGRSDFYSLGIVLFEMLTGEVPFKGENQVAVAMMHVRDDLPDVQRRRPEVSTALAVVLDRMTAKDLDQRYATDAEIIEDLEEALAIETARSGQATGEGTRVIRTLPKGARRRLPLRTRLPATAWIIGLLLVAAAVAAVVVVSLADRAEKGTGPPAKSKPSTPELVAISLGANAASDFDPPPGDGKEHPEAADLVLDRDATTFWFTERYQGGALNNKPGVGISLDAKPGVVAKELIVTTTTRGFQATIYAAAGGGRPDTLDGFEKVSGATTFDAKETRVKLDTKGETRRHYLLWVTKLPEGKDKVEISELALFK